MVQLRLTKITSPNLATTPFIIGQLIYCTDNKKCYYDHTNGQRYNSIENNVVVYNSFSDFTSTNMRYMNKVYIDLTNSLFYKFNFTTIAFELVYTDVEFINIISQSVALEGATLQDIQSGTFVMPVTTSSNVYSSLDGITRLDEILKTDLYITNTAGSYVEARSNNQKVFKIPFPVSKYSLYRDHMTVIRTVDGKTTLMSASDYTINNGYMIINENVNGIPLGDRLLFMFYYTRTTNLNQSQIIDTENILDGSITIEKINPIIEIPISMIKQSDEAQTVNAEEKALIHEFEHFEITEVDANIVTQNVNRMFVDEGMYNLLHSLVESGTAVPTVVAYVHPSTHPASMIILRDLGMDLEQYSRTIEQRWLNTQQIYSGEVTTDLNQIRTPGNYTIHDSTTQVPNTPLKGKCKLEVETSNGLEYQALEGEWITQRIIYKDDSDNVRIFYRACGNATYRFSAWTEILSTGSGVSTLLTTAKDPIGAINEVFQFANDGRAKWLDVIGYPLDDKDKFSNLHDKTLLIKQKLVDILTAKSVTCAVTEPLQTLIGYTKNLIDTISPKKGTITSSSVKKTFTDGSTNFDSYYIEITNLYINIDTINIYLGNTLYASINGNNNGIYSIGNASIKFVTSPTGAYLNTGFRIPVESASTSYSYYAVPK